MSCSLHDVMDLEGRGVPSGFVASREFVETAAVQAAKQGFDAAVVFVRHPIQDRTDDEMKAIADDAFDGVLGLICAG